MPFTSIKPCWEVTKHDTNDYVYVKIYSARCVENDYKKLRNAAPIQMHTALTKLDCAGA